MAKSIKRNYIALVVDRSGSMGWLRRDDVINSVNAALDSYRNVKDQQNTVVLATFANKVTISAPVPAQHAQLGPYLTSGGTALFDGVVQSIEALQKLPYGKSKNTSYLVMVITDGEENDSSMAGFAKLPVYMRELQATDRWTFGFQVPQGYKDKLVKNFGIPSGNVREWEQSTRGVFDMTTSNVAATQSFFNARSAGASAVNSFYAPVTTDLSKVTVSKIVKNLVDVSPQFKSIAVDKESVIKDVVETKTKSPYVIGSTYYLLMKPEKVTPDKAVLIQEKGKKPVWGGTAARDLIGLPQGTHAKVTPGNHSNYNIYVQSRSTNRKVPRGTKVLVDVTVTKPLTPTWGGTP